MDGGLLGNSKMSLFYCGSTLLHNEPWMCGFSLLEYEGWTDAQEEVN